MAPREPVQMHMYPHKHITKNNKSKSVLGGRGAEVMAQQLKEPADHAHTGRGFGS